MNRIPQLLVVLLLCSGSVIYSQTSDPPAPGWIAYQPTQDDLQCAKYSKQEWQVTLNSDNGVIHVGMGHFITRLTPSEGTYKEEWFVPANCTQFVQQKYDCVCSTASR